MYSDAGRTKIVTPIINGNGRHAWRNEALERTRTVGAARTSSGSRSARAARKWRPRFDRCAVVLLAAGLLANGCIAVGPDFKRPSAPVAQQWNEASDAAVKYSSQEFRDWWSVFGDPDLTRLIALAYQQNLTLRVTGMRVLEARAQLGIAIGEFYPQQQFASAS